jgi:hypothetical protein
MSRAKKALDITPEERVILTLFTKGKRLSSNELFTRYQQQAPHPTTFRVFKKHLLHLCTMKLVQHRGVKRWRTYKLVSQGWDPKDPVDRYLPEWTHALKQAYIAYRTKLDEKSD